MTFEWQTVRKWKQCVFYRNTAILKDKTRNHTLSICFTLMPSGEVIREAPVLKVIWDVWFLMLYVVCDCSLFALYLLQTAARLFQLCTHELVPSGQKEVICFTWLCLRFRKTATLTGQKEAIRFLCTSESRDYLNVFL